MNEAALDKTSDPEALAMGESARFQTRLASMYSSGGDNDIDRKEALGRALKDNEVWEFWLLKQVAMCYDLCNDIYAVSGRISQCRKSGKEILSTEFNEDQVRKVYYLLTNNCKEFRGDGATDELLPVIVDVFDIVTYHLGDATGEPPELPNLLPSMKPVLHVSANFMEGGMEGDPSGEIRKRLKAFISMATVHETQVAELDRGLLLGPLLSLFAAMVKALPADGRARPNGESGRMWAPRQATK